MTEDPVARMARVRDLILAENRKMRDDYGVALPSADAGPFGTATANELAAHLAAMGTATKRSRAATGRPVPPDEAQASGISA